MKRGRAEPAPPARTPDHDRNRFWERPYASFDQFEKERPRDILGTAVPVPHGQRGKLTIGLAEEEPKGKKGKGKKLPAKRPQMDMRPFPDPTLSPSTTAEDRLIALMGDPGLLDMRKPMALFALLLEAVMSDGVQVDDVRVAKLLEQYLKGAQLAHKQVATQAVLAKAAVPTFERIGTVVADIIARHVPAASRDTALKELKMRLTDAMRSTALDVVKESGKD